jgi:hypothetical protein
MGRFFRGLVLAPCLLVTLAALAWGVSRLLGPTDAQERDLTMMRAVPPLEGRDAFSALWLLPYDIPEADRPAVVAEDIRRHAEPGWVPDEAPGLEGHRASSAEGRFPRSRPTPDEMQRFCGGDGADCLTRVAADRAGYSALLARYAGLIDRADALSHQDGLRHPRQTASGGLGVMLPPYHLSKLTATRRAFDFLEGRHADAMAGTCRDVDTWRRLGAESDLLISRMVGVAYVDIHVGLFADMLSRVPRDAALPAGCVRAFAPPAGKELSMCQAMQGEVLWAEGQVASALDEPRGRWKRLLEAVLMSEHMTLAELAQVHAIHCDPGAIRRFGGDVPWRDTRKLPGWWRIQCIGNLGGCRMGTLAQPAFGTYVDRIQDSNARIRLVGVLLRLRTDRRDARPFEQQLREASPQVRHPSRDVRTGGDGRSVRMRMRQHRDGSAIVWTVPLPPYFHAGAPSG